MPANKYSIHAAMMNTTVYGGLVSADVSENSEVVADDSGSNLYPSNRVLIRSSPTVRFESRSVSQWLTALFPSGRIIPHLEITDSTGPLYLYYKRKNNAGDASGSTAIRRVVRRGVIVPRALRVQGSQVTSIELEVLTATDLTNNAMEWETGVALPAGSAAAAALHSIRGIRNGSAGSMFNQIQSIEIDFGIEVQPEAPTNSLSPTGFALVSCSPTLQATTTDVRNAFSLYYTSPAAAASGGLIVYIAAVAIGGVTSTGALGLVFRGASSLLMCSQLSLGDEPCTATLQCLGGQGDANTDAAISLSTGLTLPAESAPSLFKAGPIYENGTELEYQQASIELGVQVEPTRVRSKYSPNDFSVMRKARSISVTTRDAEFREAIGQARAVDTDFKVWLRKMTTDSEGKADAVTEHIGLTLSSGVIVPNDLNGPSGELVSPGYTVFPESTGGATEPLALSLDAAISA